jgi:hypothetical protein
MKRVLSKSWTQQRELPGVKLSGCVKYNGNTIPRKKQPGKEKMI